MRLVKINGNLWDLTVLQASPYDKVTGHEEEVNNALSSGKDGCNRGCIRFLSKGVVRSRAYCVIEIEVNNFPSQEAYCVYHNSKGFFCKVQGRRVFLKDLVGCNND